MNLRSVLLLAGFPLALTATASAQTPGPLARTTSVDTTLAPGAVHRYAFRLDAGHSIEVTVTQRGVDVVVEVRNEQDSVLFVVDSPNGRDGPEVVALTAQPAPAESIDGVLMLAHDAPAIATWDCDSGTSQLPPWLQSPQPLHWVGGLFAPGTDPSEAFRPFRLVHEFDGIVFIPVVTAEPLTDARPGR